MARLEEGVLGAQIGTPAQAERADQTAYICLCIDRFLSQGSPARSEI
jgi:hypothetical protein